MRKRKTELRTYKTYLACTVERKHNFLTILISVFCKNKWSYNIGDKGNVILLNMFYFFFRDELCWSLTFKISHCYNDSVLNFLSAKRSDRNSCHHHSVRLLICSFSRYCLSQWVNLRTKRLQPVQAQLPSCGPRLLEAGPKVSPAHVYSAYYPLISTTQSLKRISATYGSGWLGYFWGSQGTCEDVEKRLLYRNITYVPPCCLCPTNSP